MKEMTQKICASLTPKRSKQTKRRTNFHEDAHFMAHTDLAKSQSALEMTNSTCNLTDYMVLNDAEKVAIATICLLIAPFALLANILVLIVIGCSSHLRQHPSYLFMGSLALADTVACCVFTTIFLNFHLLNPDNCSDEYLLKLGGVTTAFTSSVGSLLLMAVDRYYVIFKAYKYNVLNRKRVVVGTVILWAVAFFIAFLPLMGWRCVNGQSCSKLFPYVHRYYLGFWAILVLVVLVLILAAYGIIVWKAHRHDTNMDAEHPGKARMRLDIRLAKTFSFILLILLVCWLPILSFMMADVVSEQISKLQGKVFAFCCLLCLVNSGINPLLYTLLCRELQAALASLLSGLRRWKGWCWSNTSPIT
ncbi:cannabinoid receptor 2 [Misgurnus anguillicaudatus]|uniref:cannabinoid receptor 2 n=1 Tax=Misgurnus anguillicaudatus TaxID=75329 RepID=UPI003CCF9897